MNLRNLQANEGYRNFHEMLMKELEWGINTDTNTLYLAGDIGGETLHSGAIHMDILHRFNPKADINLNINSFGSRPFIERSYDKSCSKLTLQG